MSKNDSMGEWIQIRVSKKEKERIKELAESKRLKTGTFVRNLLLDLCDKKDREKK